MKWTPMKIMLAVFPRQRGIGKIRDINIGNMKEEQLLGILQNYIS